MVAVQQTRCPHIDGLYYHGHIVNDALVDTRFVSGEPAAAGANITGKAFGRHLPGTIALDPTGRRYDGTWCPACGDVVPAHDVAGLY